MVVAQEESYPGHSFVILMSIKLWPVFLRIHFHASELIDNERSAKPSDAFLSEDGWPAVFLLHPYIASEKERREQDEAYHSQQKVAYSLDVSLHLVHSVVDVARVVYVAVPFDVWWYLFQFLFL